MTDKPNSDSPDLARFLQDWGALWREELQAQAGEPDTMEMWKTAISLWADALLVPPSSLVPRRDSAPRAEAAAAAPDPRDAAIERLVRRVDELETRLGRLEPTAKQRRARS